MHHLKVFFALFLILFSTHSQADVQVMDRGAVSGLAFNVTGQGLMMVEFAAAGSACSQQVMTLSAYSTAESAEAVGGSFDHLYVLFSVALMTGKRVSINTYSGLCDSLSAVQLHAD